MSNARTSGTGPVGAVERLARALRMVNRPLVWACSMATIVLLGVIVVVVGAGVWWRYVLNDSLSWSEEIAKYLMVWMTFAGAPVAYTLGGHIGIELFPDSLPQRLRQLVYAVIHAMTIVVMAFLAYYGWKLALNASNQRAATMDFSLFYIYLALPAGCLLMGSIAVQFLFESIAGVLGSDRGYRSKDPEPEQIEYE